MQTNDEVTQPVVPEATPAAEPQAEMSPEEQLQFMKKATAFRHKQLVNIIGLHIENFWALANSHGVTWARKEKIKNALVEGMKGALNHGVADVSLREKGDLAKEVNSFAATLVQTLENKFLMIAQNYKEEDLNANKQTQGENNGETTNTGSSEETQTNQPSGDSQS